LSASVLSVRSSGPVVGSPSPPEGRGKKRLRAMERTQRKLDALIMSFVAWMAEKNPKPLSKRTRYEYRTRIEKSLRLAKEGGYSLLADDVRVVRYVLGRLSPHPATQRGYLAAMTHWYSFLIEQGLRKDGVNPARGIGRPPGLRYLPRPLDLKDCWTYLEAAERLGTFTEAIAILGLYQGLRRAEISGLQWQHFFPADGRIWLDVTGKASRRAQVAAHPRTVAVLRKVRTEHNDPTWVFPSPIRYGRPLTVQWFDKQHREIADEAGLPEHVVLHQLRHTFASYLRRTGSDGFVVSRSLRHSSIRSTEVYMAIQDEEVAEAIGRLDFTRPREP
jgi:integrase